MNALGVHVLLELKECNPALLDDLEFVKKVMVEAAREVGATIVGESFHRFSPQGVTGVLAIAESHISIHTWPEYRYAAADIFTCGTAIKPKIAAQYLIEKFECRKPGVSEINRGTEVLTPVGPR